MSIEAKRETTGAGAAQLGGTIEADRNVLWRDLTQPKPLPDPLRLPDTLRDVPVSSRVVDRYVRPLDSETSAPTLTQIIQTRLPVGPVEVTMLSDHEGTRSLAARYVLGDPSLSFAVGARLTSDTYALNGSVTKKWEQLTVQVLGQVVQPLGQGGGSTLTVGGSAQWGVGDFDVDLYVRSVVPSTGTGRLESGVSVRVDDVFAAVGFVDRHGSDGFSAVIEIKVTEQSDLQLRVDNGSGAAGLHETVGQLNFRHQF